MRAIRKATFEAGGEAVIAEVILHNLQILQKTLEWNLDNDIRAFRIGSELFPWMGHYSVEKLERFKEIEYECAYTGEFARENGIRLSFHPGPFNVLCSPDPAVIAKTTKELEAHSEIFDLMGYTPSFDTKINIHVGGAYGDKEGALETWTQNYRRLSASLRKRLVIENDDKRSMYSVKDLYGLHELCDGELPITFDYFHHSLHPDGLSEEAALGVAVSTWPTDVVPVTHYSESRRLEYQSIIEQIFQNNFMNLQEDLHKWPTLQLYYDQWSMIKENAHSDYVNRLPETYGHQIDVMLEAKAKDRALLAVREGVESIEEGRRTFTEVI